MISQPILLCIALFSFYLSSPVHLLAQCECPTPDPAVCPAQSTSPPYQPCTAITSANSYILRYSVAGDRGAMTFIGNTLGLNKANCANAVGTTEDITDSIGAFTTIDSSLSVDGYATLTSGDGSPAGTTLDYTLNSSSAVLNLPSGAIILHAELIWSGSFGYFCGTPISGNGVGVDPDCVLVPANGPINFTTPDGTTHLVTADPTTALSSQNPSPTVQPYYCAGNYTRSQDVTALLVLLEDTNGTYVVGGIPATISAYENDSNAAGWTLAIVYHDSTSPYVNNMSLFLGAQQGSRASVVQPAEVTGFCAQTSGGLKAARLLVSAIEGDANKMGDNMEFGPTTSDLTSLSGPNNPVNNFFCSQINDDNGNLIDTTGTFCIYNSDPTTGTLVPNGRQGYDITNVDCSSTITSGQTTAYALGTTTGDDYTINALGIQISVDSPVVLPIKQVNGALSTHSNIGDTVTFTITMENTGTLGAMNIIFQDTLQTGLKFIPGSVTLNGTPLPSADPEVGIDLGGLGIDDTDVIQYDVMILSPPLSGNIFVNQATVSFEYSACISLISTSNLSNVVVIYLPSTYLPPPSSFDGTASKCAFLNKNLYSLEATWTPPPVSTVVAYEIFNNGRLIETIPAAGPYLFNACVQSKNKLADIPL